MTIEAQVLRGALRYGWAYFVNCKIRYLSVLRGGNYNGSSDFVLLAMIWSVMQARYARSWIKVPYKNIGLGHRKLLLDRKSLMGGTSNH